VKEISAQFSVFVSDFSSRRERTKSCISSQFYPLFFMTGTYQVLHKFPVLSAILHFGNVPRLAYVPSPIRHSLRQERTKSCTSPQSYPLFFTTGTYLVLHKFQVLYAILYNKKVPSLAYVPSPIRYSSLPMQSQ
jgi:hypothetical protein